MEFPPLPAAASEEDHLFTRPVEWWERQEHPEGSEHAPATTSTCSRTTRRYGCSGQGATALMLSSQFPQEKFPFIRITCHFQRFRLLCESDSRVCWLLSESSFSGWLPRKQSAEKSIYYGKWILEWRPTTPSQTNGGSKTLMSNYGQFQHKPAPCWTNWRSQKRLH